MTCYRPVTAWKPPEGAVLFSEKKDCREIKLACGQCIGCRIAKREAWTMRCMAEASVHRDNCFLTLTYNDDNVPRDYSLRYSDFQLFMRRLRKKVKKRVRFFVAGEYGEEGGRPHYHCLLFGFNFDDRVKSNGMYSRCDLYRSETLESLWSLGTSSIGEVTYASARYCAAYTCKKVSGAAADSAYLRVSPVTGECHWVSPEFARMSLRPGIGAPWVRKYYPELIVHDGVVVEGKLKKLPKYFDSLIGDIVPEWKDEVSFERFMKANPNDSTRERLEVRERVVLAREKFNKERYG